MPRARRNKVVSLTQTQKKTRADKESLMDKVRDAARQYSYVWLFSIGNMRNAYLKEVRQLWEGSRLFYGKLGVMRKALGTSEEDEVRTGLSKLSNKLSGPVGLLFTDSPPKEVQEWFDDYSRQDFSRAGNPAASTVELPEGPIMMRSNPPEPLPHPIEPQLRALGMPTELRRGVPSLLRDYTVCKKGSKLTKEAAQILKHLLIMQANFRIIPLAYWSSAPAEGKTEEGLVHELELTPEQKEVVEAASGPNAGVERTKAKGATRQKKEKKTAAGEGEDEAEEDDEDEEMDDGDDVSFEDGDHVNESMMLPTELSRTMAEEAFQMRSGSCCSLISYFKPVRTLKKMRRRWEHTS